MKLVDRLARWIADKLDANLQLRFGVLLVLGSIPFYLYLPFSGEPPIVYVMSALALTVSGLSFVIGAEVLLNQEKDQQE